MDIKFAIESAGDVMKIAGEESRTGRIEADTAPQVLEPFHLQHQRPAALSGWDNSNHT